MKFNSRELYFIINFQIVEFLVFCKRCHSIYLGQFNLLLLSLINQDLKIEHYSKGHLKTHERASNSVLSSDYNYPKIT